MQFFVRLADSMAKIRKRLGGALYQELDAILQDALHVQLTLGDTARHRDWISRLLQGYYDPMYRYQHSKVSERVCLVVTSPRYWTTCYKVTSEYSTKLLCDCPEAQSSMATTHL